MASLNGSWSLGMVAVQRPRRLMVLNLSGAASAASLVKSLAREPSGKGNARTAVAEDVAAVAEIVVAVAEVAGAVAEFAAAEVDASVAAVAAAVAELVVSVAELVEAVAAAVFLPHGTDQPS